jgi:MGT family glycosyltransferase
VKVLIYTTPAKGHVYPLIPIIDELIARGHRVAVRTLASEVELVASRGADAQPIDPLIEQVVLQDFRAKGSRAKLEAAVATFTERAPLDAADLQASLAQESPDVVLVDINAWGATAQAEHSGLAWAVFSPYPLSLRSIDAPPFGPGLPPARGPMGRIRDSAVRPLVVVAVERAMLPGLNRVRSDLGLPARRHFDDQILATPLVLAMTAEPFEYPRRDWPSTIRLIGPCAWDPPMPPVAGLAEQGDPLVLVTTSSEFQDDVRLVDTALDALADEPVRVLASLPAQSLPSRTLPANARVEPWIPHGQVLPHARCAITHGGMGATQKALAHGVPVVAVPFGRDQFEVARRVEVAGAGVRLPAARLTPERLRDAVRRALSMGEGAQRVARSFEAAGGATAACDALESLVNA